MTDRALLLDALLADPAKAAELPVDERQRLAAQLAAVQIALLTAPPPTPAKPDIGVTVESPGERLLKAEDVALALGIDVGAVARLKLPFRVKVGHRTIRYSEAGLLKWKRKGGLDQSPQRIVT